MASKTECKVIVLARLESGDEVKVSVKAEGKPLSLEHKNELIRRIKNDLVPVANDTIYYTVRRNKNGKKDNWKAKTFAKMLEIIDDIFNVTN